MEDKAAKAVQIRKNMQRVVWMAGPKEIYWVSAEAVEILGIKLPEEVTQRKFRCKKHNSKSGPATERVEYKLTAHEFRTLGGIPKPDPNAFPEENEAAIEATEEPAEEPVGDESEVTE